MSDASGRTLLQSPLTDPSNLDGFTANTNSESALIDGAKRDRFVWSGDLAVSAPTLYYSSGASDAIAGSLRLHGSYQRSSGQVPGNLPPQLRPGLAPGDVMPSTYYYSLSYSIYFVTTLYEYYLLPRITPSVKYRMRQSKCWDKESSPSCCSTTR